MKVTLLSWNVAGRVQRQPEQAALIAELTPDVVCLQEVRPTTASAWTTALKDAGWPYIALAQATNADAGDADRRLAVLTASRTPLAEIELEIDHDLPWPERVLATDLDGLHLVNFHSPISPKPNLVKVRTHVALHAHLAAGHGPRALCGDLNTPRREHPDGRVWTFARTSRGKLRPERGERWDQAELALIKGLERYGFCDAFRALHGYERKELSWQWQRWGGGYRLDHLIVSAEIDVDSVEYLHAWRQEAGLSDHSPLLADIRW
ncbi:MAG: endonuclease/exonuclease/phosphatase family protein [Solirubrobacterales bacterium]|nr:endonuclease/exonuclease/phosphatase family protein [Solirubrobacterales bacterium]